MFYFTSQFSFHYSSYQRILRILGGMEIVIISTSRGIMTDWVTKIKPNFFVKKNKKKLSSLKTSSELESSFGENQKATMLQHNFLYAVHCAIWLFCMYFTTHVITYMDLYDILYHHGSFDCTCRIKNLPLIIRICFIFM